MSMETFMTETGRMIWQMDMESTFTVVCIHCTIIGGAKYEGEWKNDL